MASIANSKRLPEGSCYGIGLPPSSPTALRALVPPHQLSSRHLPQISGVSDNRRVDGLHPWKCGISMYIIGIVGFDEF